MLTALFTLAVLQSGNRVVFQAHNSQLESKVVLPKLGASPLDRAAAAAMERYCRSNIDRMIADSKDPELKEAHHPFALDIDPVSVYRTPKLVSVCLEVATFSGGAHGMVNYKTFTWRMTNGRPTETKLAALFRKGSDYESKVSFALMNQLRTMDNADWVQSGEIRELGGNQLANFVVRPGGTLRFYFPPYELGSYASGPFELDVRPRELAPDYVNPVTRKR